MNIDNGVTTCQPISVKFNLANNLSLNKDFDTASVVYESIVAEFSKEAEAYWGFACVNMISKCG